MSIQSDMKCMKESAVDCRERAEKCDDPKEKKNLINEAEQYEWEARVLYLESKKGW